MSQRITMTLLVRNEADIIGDTIRFHHASGVDSFVVMDNLSTDGTADIVKALARDIEIDYLYQPQDDYSQAVWVTEMARRAHAHHRADWIINSDADEFWLPDVGDLKSVFQGLAQQVAVLTVTRHNAVVIQHDASPFSAQAHPRDSTLFERESVNSLGKPLPGKCAHRAGPNVVVAQGNHAVAGIEGDTAPGLDRLRILHFPYRELSLYKDKIRLGGAAYARNTTLPRSIGATWRDHFDKIDGPEIDAFWAGLALSREDADIGRLSERLFAETRVADQLAKLTRQRRLDRLQRSADALIATGQALCRDLTRSQAHLIDRVRVTERKNRPLYYNLRFCANGPHRHVERLEQICAQASPERLCQDFPRLRDIYSLFPANTGFNDFLAELVATAFPTDAARLKKDCAGKTVILHLSCTARLDRSAHSIASFAPLGTGFHHIVVTGEAIPRPEDEVPLSLDYDGQRLRLPVPDNYENLHRKVFYALMLVHLVASPGRLVKIDDNIVLQDPDLFTQTLGTIRDQDSTYAGRRVGAARHETQWHGWHIAKCADPLLEERGYQYPLPRDYAAGGYGYVLGPDGLSACTYMYLAMKAFFAMHAVGLEDACVGHAMYAKGLPLFDVSSDAHRLALPGLTTRERLAAGARSVPPRSPAG